MNESHIPFTGITPLHTAFLVCIRVNESYASVEHVDVTYPDKHPRRLPVFVLFSIQSEHLEGTYRFIAQRLVNDTEPYVRNYLIQEIDDQDDIIPITIEGLIVCAMNDWTRQTELIQW